MVITGFGPFFRKDQGLFKGSLNDFGAFLFLGVMLPRGSVTSDLLRSLPQGCFQLGRVKRRTYDLLGYLAVEPPQAPFEFRLRSPTWDGEPWWHLNPPRDEHEPLYRSLHILIALASERGGPMQPAASEPIPWASWFDLEAHLVGLLPWPLRASARLQAVMVNQPWSFQARARPHYRGWRTVHQLPPLVSDSANSGPVAVTFDQFGGGWLRMYFASGAQQHMIYLSYCFDPMEDLAEWVGRGLVGDIPALLHIDEEGKDAYLALRPHGDTRLAYLQVFETFRHPPVFEAVVDLKAFAGHLLSSLRGFLAGPFKVEDWFLGHPSRAYVAELRGQDWQKIRSAEAVANGQRLSERLEALTNIPS